MISAPWWKERHSNNETMIPFLRCQQASKQLANELEAVWQAALIGIWSGFLPPKPIIGERKEWYLFSHLWLAMNTMEVTTLTMNICRPKCRKGDLWFFHPGWQISHVGISRSSREPDHFRRCRKVTVAIPFTKQTHNNCEWLTHPHRDTTPQPQSTDRRRLIRAQTNNWLPIKTTFVAHAKQRGKLFHTQPGPDRPGAAGERRASF